MVCRIVISFITVTLCSGLFSPAAAQSVAASLSQYQKALAITSVTGVTATSFSGVALHPSKNELYVVDNDNANVYVLTVAGALVRTVSTSGITDPEGIVHYAGDEFFVAEEGGSRVLRLNIPGTGPGLLNGSAIPAITLGSNWGNSGIEGVGYRAANTMVYAVKETGPPRLYRISLDNAGGFVAAFANDPFSIEGKEGDAADIAALDDGNFVIVNQERNRLEGYGPEGVILSTLALGMTKPEGIAIDIADGTIYLVGEPREFAVFKKMTRNRSGAAVSKQGFSITVSRTDFLTANVTLASRSTVAVDCVLLDGRHFRVFESVMGGGTHQVRYRAAKASPGIRLFRISAGPCKRVTVYASPG